MNIISYLGATLVFIFIEPSSAFSISDKSPDLIRSKPSNGEPYVCNFSGVRTISLPLYPDRAGSPQFSYRYQIVGEIDRNQPVVLYLPGGPGGNSIMNNELEDNLIELSNELPKSLTRIFFDPRAVGCNQATATELPDDALTTNYLAEDVIAVINSLGLKKYILYGFSYGSQWATVIAGKATFGEAPVPAAVFLGGVLGRGAADGSLGLGPSYIKEWSLIQSKLSQHARQVLSSETPLGFSEMAWGKFIRRMLKTGLTVLNGTVKNEQLDALYLLDTEDPAQQKILRDSLSRFENSQPYSSPERDFSQRLFDKVDCHEFSPRDTRPVFSHGQLVPDPNEICKNEVFDRLYDSAQYQITAPIYYLSGTNDPAAPFAGAFYHFQNQHHARRNFIQVPGGGHDVLGQIFPDCKDKIWEAVIAGQDLDRILSNCIFRTQLLVAEPNIRIR